MQKRFLTWILVIALLVPAIPVFAGNGETLGTLMGAGFGGLIGNQFGHGSGRVAATVGGAVLGGAVGNSIGGSVDRANVFYYPQPAYTYPYYQSPVYYQNYSQPNYVAPPAPKPPPPPSTYVDEETGSYCREFSEETRIGGQQKESYGTACMQPDGTWRVVE